MTAAARKPYRLTCSSVPAARPTALEVFIARAEARAILWQAGELSLHDAVDELQAAAVRDGLLAELGQDAIQALMVEAFAPVRDDLRKIAETDAGDNWQALGQAAARVVVRAVPISTLQAAEYLIQQGDPERLRNWLDQHSADERAAIRKHLEAKRCRH